MAALNETGTDIYRRRVRRRAVITLSFVTSLLIATLAYAGSSVQEWVSRPEPETLGAACFQNASNKPLTPRKVTVNVYNTTARPGLAASVAARLKKQGFRVVDVENDPQGMSIQGVGEIRFGPSGAGAAALAASRMRGARIAQDERTDATVDFVMGNKFTSVSRPPWTVRPIEVRPTEACRPVS